MFTACWYKPGAKCSHGKSHEHPSCEMVGSNHTSLLLVSMFRFSFGKMQEKDLAKIFCTKLIALMEYGSFQSNRNVLQSTPATPHFLGHSSHSFKIPLSLPISVMNYKSILRWLLVRETQLWSVKLPVCLFLFFDL